jgi:hypothetical protein
VSPLVKKVIRLAAEAAPAIQPAAERADVFDGIAAIVSQNAEGDDDTRLASECHCAAEALREAEQRQLLIFRELDFPVA